jgi:hypothetical protein
MDRTMKVFYDCEFLEDGHTIDLISIGLVKDTGGTYYAINQEAPWSRIGAHPWLVKNVVKHLPLVTTSAGWAPNITHQDYKPRARIAQEVLRFLVGEDETLPEIQLNAYYAAYDHVCLMQLWGPMISAPKGVPWYTRDLKVEADRLEISTKNDAWPKQNPDLEHHALHDAWHDFVIDRYLREMGMGR